MMGIIFGHAMTFTDWLLVFIIGALIVLAIGAAK